MEPVTTMFIGFQRFGGFAGFARFSRFPRFATFARFEGSDWPCVLMVQIVLAEIIWWRADSRSSSSGSSRTRFNKGYSHLQASSVERFKYCNQIRESSRSARKNISEGFGRYYPKEFARFLRNANGSLHETKDHLLEGREYRTHRTHRTHRIYLMYFPIIGARSFLVCSGTRDAWVMMAVASASLQAHVLEPVMRSTASAIVFCAVTAFWSRLAMIRSTVTES